MDTALHGRMKIGRCVKNDYGHLGCHNDALQSFDRACSGRRTCDVTVTNNLRQEEDSACAPIIVGYAEVAYHCQQGAIMRIRFNFVQCSFT